MAKFGKEAEMAAAQAFGEVPSPLSDAKEGSASINVGVSRAPDGTLKVTLEIEQADGSGFTTGFDPEFAGAELAGDLFVSAVMALGPSSVERMTEAFGKVVAKRVAEIAAGDIVKRGE